MKIKIGIVGTNKISHDFCEAAIQNQQVELFAVYSRAKETGERFARAHAIPHVFTEYTEFLNSDIDAVYIASPNYIHCEQAIQAMKEKKHVLCEKVMALNEEEAEKMILCAKENKVILLEAMRSDFDPAFDMVKEQLPKIGTIRRVDFEYCQYSSRYDNFLDGIVENAFNPEMYNSAVRDIGVYCIHAIIRMFGMPERVESCSTLLSNGFEGSGVVLMKYPEFLAQAVYSKITASVNPSVIQGEKGSILLNHIGRPTEMEIRIRRSARDGLKDGNCEKIPYEPVPNNMIYEIQKFCQLINEQNIDHPYLEISLNTIRVIDQVMRRVVKEKAESILSTLGIPASSAINMFYKQIILQRGLPFEVKLPSARPVDVSRLSEAEFNEELEKGYADMQAGRTKNAKKAFADIRKDYGL